MINNESHRNVCLILSPLVKMHKLGTLCNYIVCLIVLVTVCTPTIPLLH